MENEYKYLVVKIGWEYDDNWYNCSEEKHYHIDSKLLDKDEAEKEERKKTVEFVRGGRGLRGMNGCEHFSFHFYYLEDEDKELSNFLYSIGGDGEAYTFPPTATDEEILVALELANLTFYKTEKVCL